MHLNIGNLEEKSRGKLPGLIINIFTDYVTSSIHVEERFSKPQDSKSRKRNSVSYKIVAEQHLEKGSLKFS